MQVNWFVDSLCVNVENIASCHNQVSSKYKNLIKWQNMSVDAYKTYCFVKKDMSLCWSIIESGMVPIIESQKQHLHLQHVHHRLVSQMEWCRISVTRNIPAQLSQPLLLPTTRVSPTLLLLGPFLSTARMRDRGYRVFLLVKVRSLHFRYVTINAYTD